jgi:hypothetical protein
MPLECLQLLPVLQADDVVWEGGLLDRHAGSGFATAGGSLPKLYSVPQTDWMTPGSASGS